MAASQPLNTVIVVVVVEVSNFMIVEQLDDNFISMVGNCCKGLGPTMVSLRSIRVMSLL